jgi:hypothetical protein
LRLKCVCDIAKIILRKESTGSNKKGKLGKKMKPDYNEDELVVIDQLEQYFKNKTPRKYAETYYCLGRSITDARRYIERNNFQMARRIILEGCELVEALYLDMEENSNA